MIWVKLGIGMHTKRNKIRSKHSTWQSWDMPCQCFFVVWFTPFVGRSFWLHCLRWLRAALKQGKHNIYEPTHHPMGTSLISLQWTEKSMRFRAFLTKITMQETQHGQRIYHLVGGLKTILRNMSIQWEGLCHICLKKNVFQSTLTSHATNGVPPRDPSWRCAGAGRSRG